MRNRFADLHGHYHGRKSTVGGIFMVLGLGACPMSFVKEYWNIPYPTPKGIQPIGAVRRLKELARATNNPDDHFLHLLTDRKNH